MLSPLSFTCACRPVHYADVMKVNSRNLRTAVRLATIALAAVLLVMMLAAPGLGVGRAIGDALSVIGRTLSAKATVARYELPLKDGESSETLEGVAVTSILAERAAGAPILSDLLASPGLCLQVRPSGGTAAQLLVCAPSVVSTSGVDPSASMPPKEGLTHIELLRAQQMRLTVDPQVQASWIAEGEELKEHRELLLADGYAVGTTIISASFDDRTPMGTILEWSGGAEWIGYLWVGGDTYLTWAWAPDRAELDALLNR